MYLAKLHLQNWRTYSDVTFDFAQPTARKSVVLIGAMNGHGKTSFLMSLYLGLFGRFGLRYCEGFSKEHEPEPASYRQAIERYRRNVAPAEEPTRVDVTLAPTIGDSTGEEEVRVVRRWYFTGQNKAKPGAGFEEVDVYVGGRLQKHTSLDKDPLVLAYERVERNLFPAHVAPAFFFDGDQAQKLIEKTGEAGLKRAVEIMYGTKIIAEVADRVGEHIARLRQRTGGQEWFSDKKLEIDVKIQQRDEINAKLATLQADHQRLECEKEEKENERSNLQIELAQMGGSGAADAYKLQGDFVRIEREVTDAEKALADSVRSLGIALAMSRLHPAVAHRLKAEEARETWEGLKRGTLDNKEKVLSFAIPEPPEADHLLGHLDAALRIRIRDRFADALERIYNPPPPESAKEYVLGHIKGDARSRVIAQMAHVQSGAARRATASARRLRDARESQEDIKAKMALLDNLPHKTQEIRERLDVLNNANQDHSRKLGLMEGEIRKLKADLHTINEEIGRIQEQLARLGPEQKRIAVAERVRRALDVLQEQLKPTTTARLEECVTKYFLKIADPEHFGGGKIRLTSGGPPDFEWPGGKRLALESISGFEKRSFAIGFSLALADIIRRRIPLVIDTPLGNADSKYRPRTLRTLTNFDLDQVIILTHDEEVTRQLVDLIRPSILQTFLVEKGGDKGSKIYANRYFNS